MTSLPSYKWTSRNSWWKDTSPRPSFLAVVQPLLPLHAMLWCLPPRQRAKSAWPWRSVNSYHGQLWTPPAKHWGVPPPKDQCPLASGAPSSLRLESSAKPMDISSQVSLQVSILDNAEPNDPTLEEISLPVKILGLGAGFLPRDVIQLQEEVGKALGCLLVTRSSLDACWRKQILDFEMGLCQNESETTESIKETKTLCTHTTREAEANQVMLISKAEAWHATCIKEAEANCASIIAEAENCCSTVIRKVESCGTKQACSIQQSHAEGMQHLEMEAIGEEGKDHLSFLAACEADPLRDHGVLVTPFHLLLENIPSSTLLSIPPSSFHLTCICPTSSSSYCPHGTWALGPIQMATPPSWTVSPPQSEATPWVAPEEPPHSKRREEMPLHKVLTESQWEAFTRDSDLVQKAREEHYKTKCPHFNCKTSCNLMNIFRDIIASTSLLGSQIYKIQEVWEGQNKLPYANDVLRALPKGLQFFCTASPSELPKVMGLAGVHNPDALHHFSGLTFCPWCGKEGQNKGTIVNHLWTTHYKLGLVCGTCFHCPSVTSEAIWCHGWKSCQYPQGEDGDLDDTSSSA